MMIKQKIALLFDDKKGNLKGDKFVEYFISWLIIINMIAIILESYKGINTSYFLYFNILEIFSIIVFSIEYLLRIWISDLIYPDISPTRARVKYITSFMGVVDLISILPFFLPYFIKIDLRILRTLRLFRLLRLLKLNRYFKSLSVIKNVIVKTKSEILVTVFMVFILLILASTLMYNIEKNAQPEAFQNIGQAMWWAVATLTTVGYGDIYPITGLGKILSAFIALLGIGIVALPTGIISSAYIEEIRELRTKKEICNCPHCGKEIID
ncbi:ion transporter [Tenacibaculum ovolyticum]|uniref:ion transporter n=2 Tax=Tenacibaculum ovolyticum TaxID=104270 RepID=UPI00048E5A46|nr:ion transporter [Tenacibaculum ovolyticum]WBX76492.1 ion transporter [Tenacibaculum ovolyticum]